MKSLCPVLKWSPCNPIIKRLLYEFKFNSSSCVMPDAEGRTPIHIAAGVGKINVLEILLNVMPANIEDISYDENDPDILHQLVPIHNPQFHPLHTLPRIQGKN